MSSGTYSYWKQVSLFLGIMVPFRIIISNGYMQVLEFVVYLIILRSVKCKGVFLYFQNLPPPGQKSSPRKQARRSSGAAPAASMSLQVLQVFVAARAHMPRHRCAALYHHLLRLLGPRQHAWQLAVQTAEHAVRHRGTAAPGAPAEAPAGAHAGTPVDASAEKVSSGHSVQSFQQIVLLFNVCCGNFYCSTMVHPF